MTYDDALSLRDARQRYFTANGFDGSYSERWVKLKAGPFTFGFPNAPGRVRAVKLHDLHHVVTGYATDLIGEMEEIAATFASIGLTPRMLEGSADMYRFVGATPLADQTSRQPDPSLDEMLETLARSLGPA